jgi:hypothetical protein
MPGALLWQLEYRGIGRLASPAYQHHPLGAALVVYLRFDPDAPPIAKDRHAIMREVALT